MKRIVLFSMIAAACTSAKAAVSPAGNLIVEELQAGDSGRFRVTWAAPVSDASHATPTGYHVRLIRDSAAVRAGARQDTLVYHQIALRLVDTFVVARPLIPTDSVPLRVVVRSVACAATPCLLSPFVSTTTWFLKFRILGPNPPGPVTVDTLALQSVTVRPAIVATSVGATVQLCAFGTLIDGTKGMFPYGRLAGSSDSTALDTTGYCLDQFNRWLSERPA